MNVSYLLVFLCLCICVMQNQGTQTFSTDFMYVYLCNIFITVTSFWKTGLWSHQTTLTPLHLVRLFQVRNFWSLYCFVFTFNLVYVAGVYRGKYFTAPVENVVSWPSAPAKWQQFLVVHWRPLVALRRCFSPRWVWCFLGIFTIYTFFLYFNWKCIHRLNNHN